MISARIRSLACRSAYVRLRAGRSFLSILFFGLAFAWNCIAAQTPLATKTTLAITTDFTIGLLQASDGNFYSTSGAANEGCQDNQNNQCSFIYKITPSGTISAFHTFQEVPAGFVPGTIQGANADGLEPTALIEGTDGNFYGTCQSGGAYGIGTIFEITPAGGFSLLYTFSMDANGNQVNGSGPISLLQGSDGNLYGTTASAVPGGVGTAGLFFQVTTSGIFTAIHYFPDHMSATDQNFDFPEGTYPNSIVQGNDGNFYVTMRGGAATYATNNGSIDQITPGGQVTVTHAFAADDSEGNAPLGPLVEGSDGNFYGTTSITVGNPNGIPELAYKVSAAGNLLALHQFTGGADGGHTRGNLFLGSDGNFYGAAAFGGDTASVNCARAVAPGCGTFYQLQPSGALVTLHTFEGGVATSFGPSGNAMADGAAPTTPIVQAQGGLFYGIASGGPTSSGTFYSLALTNPIPAPVQLSFDKNPVAPNSPTVLTWKVLNAFSTTAQQCGAVIQGAAAGAGIWGGPQTGTLANNVYSGTATITPTLPGIYTYALTCGGTESGFVTLVVKGPLMVPAALPNGLVGVPYVMPLAEFSGTPPYTTTVTSGKLPAGLTLNAATGVLQGTPMQFGVFTPGLQITDSATPQQTVSGTTMLTIQSSLTIINSALTKGVAGNNYSQILVASGGVPPYVWSVTSGTLPDGIKLSASAGILSGLPTKKQTQTITLQVADSEGTSATSSVTLPFVILPPIPIASVEFTQAIQQYQSLSDLQASLNANGEPPVPIIAGKLAAMRVYFAPVTDATTVSLEVDGAINETKTLDLQPNCQPTDERAGLHGCSSMDFYFTPPAGTWGAVLMVSDASGDPLETEAFSITSRTTESINLKGVTACDTSRVYQSPSCGSPAVLLSLGSYLGRIMPTTNVNLSIMGLTATDDSFDYPQTTQESHWINYVVRQTNAFYTAADTSADAAANQRTTYVGIYAPKLFASSISVQNAHGALVASPSIVFDNTDVTGETVAHEVGHTLSLKHTNVKPAKASAPPGCFGIAEDPTSYWPPFMTNNVQSTQGLEYGFDVLAESLKDPNSTFDIMSYCTPRWISPVQYNLAITTLGGDSTSQAMVSRYKAQIDAAVAPRPRNTPILMSGTYMQVSGVITSTGVTFDPIFAELMNGSADPGAGTYSIVMQDASGHALYTRAFNPVSAEVDLSDGTTGVGDISFSEWVPNTTGAARIVVLDPTSATLGTVALTGSVPVVAIIAPTAGFVGSSLQTISWTIQSSTATSFTSRTLYSTDGGTTWIQIGQTTDTSYTQDFSQLPGATNALVRVLASDGVNTGSATSVPFSVTKKAPSTIVINTPTNGAVQPAANPVYLSGGVYDADDGVLKGSALQWSSNIQGALGSGSPLSVSLTPGTHIITLTGTDSDGNAITATSNVTLGGAGPVLTLTTAANSSNCVNATVSAVSGAMGANLSLVQYSLDGGVTYTTIPTGSLPFNLTVPVSGSINLVARAYDASGQSAARSTELSIPPTCGQIIQTTPVITWSAPAAIAYGTQLAGTQLNATASVPGTFVYSPAAGAVLMVGTQTLSTTFTPTDAVDYTSATSTTTVAVTPAPLTITPVNATRTYGSSNPVFTFGAAGFINGDSSTSLSGSPVLTTSATIASAPGSYPISAAQGTLAAANYSFVFGSGTLTVTKAGSTSTVQASAASVPSGSPETLTISVSSAVAGTPTGMVSFFDGTSLLGSATLTNGQGSLTTSSLVAGAHTLNINYSGDADFAASSGNASVTVTAAPADFTFTSGGSTTQTVQPGQVATYSFALAPLQGGYPAAVAFTISGLPTGATATFAPSSLAANSTAQTVTLSVQTPAQAAAVHGDPLERKSISLVLGFLLFPLAMWRLRRSSGHMMPFGLSMLIVLIGMALAAGFSGCGGKSNSSSQAPQTYTLFVTATNGSVQHTVSMTLIVQ